MTPEELSRTPSRSAGSRRPARRAREEVDRLRVHLPGAGAQARAGQDPLDPATRRGAGRDRSRSTAMRGRSSSSAGRASRMCRCREALIPAPVRHRRPGGRARADRPLAARRTRRYPAVESDPPPRRLRPRRADHRPRGDGRPAALARRAPPRDPGAARLGQDVDVGAADRPPGRRRQDGRGRLDEPPGDPQAPRRGRGARGRAGARLRGREEGERRQPRVGVRRRAGRERLQERGAADAELLGGTAWLFSDPELDGRLDYLFIDEAGQVSLADACAMATCAHDVVLVGDPQQLGQVLQGTHPDGTRGLGARTSARRRRRRSRPTAASSSSAPSACTRTSAATSPRSSTSAGCCPTPSPRTRTTPFGTGLR